MTKNVKLGATIVMLLGLTTILFVSSWYMLRGSQLQFNASSTDAILTKFTYLATHGNSSCSASFNDSVVQLPSGARLQGSCCSSMDVHRYGEQVEGLKPYRDIKEIPPDPYDIDAALAKGLQAYYDTELTLDEQKAYDYAVQNSDEKGPCCCKCWRWYVYGGLGKYLIRNYGFTGEQVTKVWNLSDGCGGPGDHVNHS